MVSCVKKSFGHHCSVEMSATILSLSGVSATGKTTLALAMQRALTLTTLAVVHADEFLLPADHSPRVALDSFAWPSGRVPNALAARGFHDHNVPEALDWTKLGEAICAARCQNDHVLVEGHLLLAHGAEDMRALVDHHAVLEVDSSRPKDMEALWRRKFERARDGRQAYCELGMTRDEYECYWAGYVWPRWVEYGESKIPPDALRLDCHRSVAQNVAALLATRWFETPRNLPRSHTVYSAPFDLA